MKRLFCLICVAVLVACGGGGGGGTTAPTTPAPTTFQVTDPAIDEVGEFTTFQLTGTVSNDVESVDITASISLTRLPNEILVGEEVTVLETVIVVTFLSQGTSISTGETEFTAVSDGSLRVSVDIDGVVCFADADYKPLPDSVMIDQSGILGTTICTDGDTVSQTYLVEVSTKNSQWAAIRVFSTTTTPGGPDIIAEGVRHVSADGRTQALELIITDGSIIVELST